MIICLLCSFEYFSSVFVWSSVFSLDLIISLLSWFDYVFCLDLIIRPLFRFDHPSSVFIWSCVFIWSSVLCLHLIIFLLSWFDHQFSILIGWSAFCLDLIIRPRSWFDDLLSVVIWSSVFCLNWFSVFCVGNFISRNVLTFFSNFLRVKSVIIKKRWPFQKLSKNMLTGKTITIKLQYRRTVNNRSIFMTGVLNRSKMAG